MDKNDKELLEFIIRIFIAIVIATGITSLLILFITHLKL